MIELYRKDWPEDVIKAMDEIEDLRARSLELCETVEFIIETITNAERVAIDEVFGRIFVAAPSTSK